MSDNRERLLDYLTRSESWVTATELADRLGVTTRSVRSYVTAVKNQAGALTVIESSASGYRLDRDAYARFLASEPTRQRDEAETPRDRLYSLVRRLSDAEDGLEIHAIAEAMHVSESTIEADLRRVKALADEAQLTLSRRGSLVRLEGGETGRRRLISRMFRDESAQGIFTLEDVQREFSSRDLGAFKTALLDLLESRGLSVNEYGLTSVLLHLAIAVDRSDRRTNAPAQETSLPHDTLPERLRADLGRLILEHFDVEPAPGDLTQIAVLLATRVVTPGNDESAESVVENYVDPGDLAIVRRIVREVAAEYLVDLDDAGFVARLALHVGNLVVRAHDRSFSRNPLTRSIKSSFPMTYEIAVFIASRIQALRAISVNDDEIAYIALHVGSYLERVAGREDRLRCVIVCPNYHDLATMLRERVERALGAELEIVQLVTRSDVRWADIDADIVLTTITAHPLGDEAVVVQPFLTAHDEEAVRRTITRRRRHSRRAQIKGELLRFFDEGLFLRNVHARDETAMIRLLGRRMVERDIIDEAYVDGAVERERMSSTAFTENIAVPHAMTMSARRTSIAIVVNDTPMDWGEQRVNVIAMIAFAAEGRRTFQGVFDQFVEVFAERGDVQQLIRRSTDFSTFIEELVRLMDA